MNAAKTICILCFLSISVLGLTGQSLDTIPLIINDIPDAKEKDLSFNHVEYTFNAKQIILPTSLFAAGALGTFLKPYKDLNVMIRDKVSDMRGNHKTKIDDYAQYLPTAAHLFLGLTRIPHQNTFLQRISIDATSAISLTILTNVLKYTFREKRPDSSARNSFPSGHTATAFMGAELMRIEYGPYWGLGGYCVATAVGLLRIYNGRHWLNDVIAGAGIGILSARIGFWMLPLYNKWFFRKVVAKKNNDRSLALSAIPSYDYYSRTVTINCVFVF